MRLKSEDKFRINSFYRKTLAKHGTKSAKSLDWDSDFNQRIRFDVLSKIGDLDGKSILDFGCGLGDFYGYVSKRFKGLSYLGIDVVPELIETARKKYPKGKFEVTEFGEVSGKFDYIFASGSLTFHVQGGKEFYFKLIREMYDQAKVGVGFNMLNKGFYDTDPVYLCYDPLEVMEYCETFAKDVKIIFEYLQGDFTVYLYKHKQSAK